MYAPLFTLEIRWLDGEIQVFRGFDERVEGLTRTVPIVPVTFSATALGIVALALLIRRRELLKLREQSERKGVRSKDSVKNR